MKFVAFVCFIMSGASCLAINELGTLEVAKKNCPAIFVPGNVLEYSIEDVSGYVFNGEAERCFDGDMAEKDAELYQEAALDAKANLHKFLKKKTGASSVQVSGAVKLYEYPEGKMRRVVLFAAKKNIVASLARNEPVKPTGENASTVNENRSAINENNVSANESIPKKEEFRNLPEGKDAPVSPVATNVAAAVPPNADARMAIGQGAVQTSKVDRIAAYLKQIADNPGDCIAMSKAAKLYARQRNLAEAKRLYSKIVNTVITDERMDKEFASGLLMESARFEKGIGDVNLALKYYRLVIRCDGLRRWGLREQVAEANKNISELLLVAF